MQKFFVTPALRATSIRFNTCLISRNFSDSFKDRQTVEEKIWFDKEESSISLLFIEFFIN